MAYRIAGLPLGSFAHLIGADDATLARQNALRTIASARPGAPCRVTLDDAEPGESLLLLNHVSHDVANPYRATHAIFIRESAAAPASYTDEIPPALATRVLSLRGFDAQGMMIDARIAQRGEAEQGIGALFANPAVAYIHAHNAARGCFAARIDRHGDAL